MLSSPSANTHTANNQAILTADSVAAILYLSLEQLLRDLSFLFSNTGPESHTLMHTHTLVLQHRFRVNAHKQRNHEQLAALELLSESDKYPISTVVK